MKTIIKRWKAETPKFFKRLIRISFVVGGVCTGLWTVNSTMGLDAHWLVLAILKCGILGSTFVSLTAKLAQEQPKDSEEPR